MSGGCSGFEWELSEVTSIDFLDIQLNIYGINFFFSPEILKFLDGITLDYKVIDLQGKIKISSSNYETCGCGDSFNVA